MALSLCHDMAVGLLHGLGARTVCNGAQGVLVHEDRKIGAVLVLRMNNDIVAPGFDPVRIDTRILSQIGGDRRDGATVDVVIVGRVFRADGDGREKNEGDGDDADIAKHDDFPFEVASASVVRR